MALRSARSTAPRKYAAQARSFARWTCPVAWWTGYVDGEDARMELADLRGEAPRHQIAVTMKTDQSEDIDWDTFAHGWDTESIGHVLYTGQPG